MSQVERRTVDLSAFPDLVVIYLGLRMNALAGLKTIFGFGPKIASSVAEKPDGLLLHEAIVYSIFPIHAGMRQYWRDFDSLERWARSETHKLWWRQFLRDSGGTGFWHEMYFMRGGMEAVYDGVPVDIGFLKFATVRPARGPLFSARGRAGRAGEPTMAPAIEEKDFYGEA